MIYLQFFKYLPKSTDYILYGRSSLATSIKQQSKARRITLFENRIYNAIRIYIPFPTDWASFFQLEASNLDATGATSNL